MQHMFINRRVSSKGFTLVEMLIVAPIVILVIGIFISAIVNMTGSVLSTRGANDLTYRIQEALDTIDQDTKTSGGYLASNTIALQTGQGYDNSTLGFKNNSDTYGNMLILNTYATTSSDLASTKNYIYAKDQPNACNSTSISQNPKVMMNVIYFVKDDTLWRRVIAPDNYDTVGCNAPWQKPSCNPGVSAAFCKIKDTKLVEGIDQTSGFSVQYYTSSDTVNEIANANNAALSDTARQTALKTASSIKVTIASTKTVSGRDIGRTSQIRTSSPNNNTESQIITTQPSDKTVTAGSNATFTAISSATGATVQWKQSTNNGASWVNMSGATSTTLTRTSVTNDMDGYQFRAVFTDSLGTVTSSAARLTVNLNSWSSFSLQNSWSDYGAGYQANGYRKTTSGVVQLKGLIKRTGTPTLGEVIAVLPASYRPTASLFFPASTNPNVAGRITVDSSGNVILQNGDAGWISLDNVHFIPNNGRYDGKSINTFKNGWDNYSSGVSPVAYIVDDVGRIHLRGILSMGTIYDGAQIFDMPSDLMPSLYMHIPATAYGGTFSAIGLNGTYVNSGNSVVSKGLGTNYLGINVMYHPNAYSGDWQNLTMANSWVAYGGNFATPQYTKGADGLVSLKGLIKAGTATSGTVMATLPSGFRPSATILYAGYSTGAYARIDINSSGDILFRTGSNSWLSLDGITFYADQ